MQELWLPVMYPPHSKRIDISVGHKELTGMETFAHLYFNLDNVVISKSGNHKKGIFVSQKTVEKAKAKYYNGPPLEWHNLYGSRCSKPQGNKIIALQNKYPRLVSNNNSISYHDELRILFYSVVELNLMSNKYMLNMHTSCNCTASGQPTVVEF